MQTYTHILIHSKTCTLERLHAHKQAFALNIMVRVCICAYARVCVCVCVCVRARVIIYYNDVFYYNSVDTQFRCVQVSRQSTSQWP